MTDIVERLRKSRMVPRAGLLDEAADEIERLEAELNQVRAILIDREDEITRLRAGQ